MPAKKLTNQEKTDAEQQFKKEMIEKVSIFIKRQKFPFQIKVTQWNKNRIEGNDEHNNKQ